MPTKIPSRQTKRFSMINKTLIMPRKKPSTPTKYQVRQPKYQVCQPKIYAVLSRGNFCHKFTHFFGVLFAGQKVWWRTNKDKYQV